jgi:tetratricopeptide (TPR) repeat protein
LQTAATIADDAGDLRYQAWCRANLSSVLCTKGEYPRARQLAQEALHIRQELGDRAATAHSLSRLGEIAAALADYQLATQHYQDAVAIANEVGDPNHEYAALNGLGRVAAALGRYAEAQQRLEESLSMARKIGQPPLDSLIGLGHVARALREYDRSRQCFREALELALRARRMLEALDALVGLASLSAREGAPERAVELLALASHHPATTKVTRDRAQELLLELKSELSPEVFAAATARGQARELEEVAAAVLAENAAPH